MNGLTKAALALLVYLFSMAASAAIDVYDFESEQQEQEFRELTLQLRCPKCQNNSIGDSNSVIATDMRAKVYQLMQQGYTKQQVIDYMVARYGNFVTYQPPMTMATMILWVGPVLFLVLGILFIIKVSRRRLALNDDNDSLALEDKQRLTELLNEQQTSQQGGNKS